ncbi:hypothetical protein KUL49_31280 [Alteromonas sp. KUL49]|nr:hypothetical protein KUL49_31280 [Alteromonas sp. KUL49]
MNNLTTLGESPLWSSKEQCWYYVDIANGVVFRRKNGVTTVVSDSHQNVSNLVNTQKGLLATAEDQILQVIPDTDNVKLLLKIAQSSDLRTNDGSVGPDGRYWFGTMEKNPSGLHGKIYSLSSNGKLRLQGEGIGIPNTFVWLNSESILISDSFLKITYEVDLLDCGKLDWDNRKVWLDLRNTNGTPDGGTLDENGDVWIAIWGGAAVQKYSPDGVLLDKLSLRALQPTSCAFGGTDLNELLVTTATEDLSVQQLDDFPDSGRVIHLNMDVKGKVLPEFIIEEQEC